LGVIEKIKTKQEKEKETKPSAATLVCLLPSLLLAFSGCGCLGIDTFAGTSGTTFRFLLLLLFLCLLLEAPFWKQKERASGFFFVWKATLRAGLHDSTQDNRAALH
jgi:hypothetical protein